jgi:hypothetical protein
MNLSTLKNKKSLKIVTLLVSALLIAVVSAQVYSYMYIEGSATIATGVGLNWALGASAPTGTTVNGYTVENMNFTIPENTFMNYTDCLELVNNDATSHTFSLATTITSGSPSAFTSFDMVVYDSSNIGLTKIDILTAGSDSGLEIAGLATLYVRFEVDPVINATSGSLAFTIQLTYE